MASIHDDKKTLQEGLILEVFKKDNNLSLPEDMTVFEMQKQGTNSNKKVLDLET